jgi:ABC-type antimicrobial peptide transport system permease subunit
MSNVRLDRVAPTTRRGSPWSRSRGSSSGATCLRRAALGATSKSLTILVLRESVVLVGLGLGAGLLLSYLGPNVIRAFLFRVQPLDPTTLVSVATLILLLAIAVSMRPALRAARVDLAEVLRSE